MKEGLRVWFSRRIKALEDDVARLYRERNEAERDKVRESADLYIHTDLAYAVFPVLSCYSYNETQLKYLSIYDVIAKLQERGYTVTAPTTPTKGKRTK